MKDCKYYYTHHMKAFEKFDKIAYKNIEVLSFLKGKPWDALALGYVHALRPSNIRVTTDMITLDASLWRVTVYVDANDIIEDISQEVEIGLPEGVVHGEAMGMALAYGIDSPQCQWHNDDDITSYSMTPCGYYKHTSNGKIKFPDPEDAFDEAGKDI